MKNIKNTAVIICVVLAAIAAGCGKKSGNGGGGGDVGPTPVPPVVPVKTDVQLWLTMPDRSIQFAKQNISLLFGTGSNSNPTINVDTTQVYQTIDGFGFTLTGGSASVLNSLPETQKTDLLKELFLADTNNIGISYLRVSVGASDLSATPFTYDDTDGTPDVSLSKFSIDAERTDLIPILKKIIALNPSIKILACPWSAPAWMKTNNSLKGGSLKPEYFAAFAQYFVKYIQAMKAEGITIDAITPQNEPLNSNNNPAMYMPATDQIVLIKDHLGPAFKAAGLNTKIINYDHNADGYNYSLTVLGNADAYKYTDGSAFHLYNGNIDQLMAVHNAYPDKNLYFTEQYTPTTGGFSGDLNWHITNLIVGATRNWCRNVLEWNLATDGAYGPHTQGGCSTCLGALTVVGNNVSRNVSYYIIAHASKFVRPGAVRIASDMQTGLPNVAFKNANGKKVLIVLNSSSSTQNFNIKFNGKLVTTYLFAGAVGTYVW